MSEELRNNNKEIEIKIAENAAEIMLIYTDLVKEKKIKSMSDEDINSCEFINNIAEWAREFEYENPECDDWLYEIDQFAQGKLLEKYGIKKRKITYVRFYNGKEHVYITVVRNILIIALSLFLHLPCGVCSFVVIPLFTL